VPDQLKGIAIFVEAAEAGGFSAAAARLNLSRSAVAKTVARLEQRLATRLFHRTTRSQSLTNEGQAYYEHCKRALAELRAGEALLDSGRQEVSGRLRVTMPVLFGRYCVAPLLMELARQHAGLELVLSFNDRNVDLLNDGFDLAVRNGRLGQGDGLMVRRLAQQRMSLCAAPSYLAARGTPGSTGELSTHEVIAYSRSGRIRAWTFIGEDGTPQEILPEARLRFDDLEVMADAAVRGLGLAWLPAWLIRHRLRTGELVLLLPERCGFAFGCHAVWPQSPQLPHRVRVAIDALAVALPDLMD
jgi:DNA-binding transcriptional LysR family regulator